MIAGSNCLITLPNYLLSCEEFMYFSILNLSITFFYERFTRSFLTVGIMLPIILITTAVTIKFLNPFF